MKNENSVTLENSVEELMVEEIPATDENILETNETEFEFSPESIDSLENEEESSENYTENEEEEFEFEGFEELSTETLEEEYGDPQDAIFGSYEEHELGSDMKDKLSSEAMEVVIGRDNRRRISPTTSYPWRAICSLKIRTKTGKNYIGTGWMISPRTVITAGHCVYMHREGGWPASIEVIPGLNGASRPYGSVKATSFRSVKGWTKSKKRNYDYGAIILPKSKKLGLRTGTFGVACKSLISTMASKLNLSGYPADKGGNTQWFMSKRPKLVTARTIVYDIDTYGGQSGAPVWIKKGNKRYVVGIHTNGFRLGNSATRIVKPVYRNIINWKNQGR